jgi:Tfp pilus assembly protein PilF
VEPFYWLGELYRSTGQNDLARQSYEKCFSLGPETPIGIKCGELR